MRVIAVQPDIQWEDAPATIAAVRAMLSDITLPAESLIVLPEMFSTGFSMNTARIAEGDTHPGEACLRELAMHHQSATLGGVVVQPASGKALNQALAFDPAGQTLARYSKIHPFSYAGESDHYAAGRQVMTFDHAGWRIAPTVCYDLRFAELFRLAAVGGAGLLVVIANWPASRIEQWHTLLVARAIENQAYVVGVNRVGSDPQSDYIGRSLIVDPVGRVIAQGDDQPGLVQADIDLATLQICRERFPALRDMRYRWSDDGFA